MNQVEMVMPKMGESIMEGTILKWLKNEGDFINEDESVLEVATCFISPTIKFSSPELRELRIKGLKFFH